MPYSAQQLDTIKQIARGFGATRLILFGSALTEPDTARDIDLACDGVTGWQLFALLAKLEDVLRLPLDLVPLSPPSRFTRMIEQKGLVLL